MPAYNGHKNWNHWNVALWIANDEGLYRQALRLKRIYGSKRAAEELVGNLAEHGITKTDDGARYSVTAVRAAIAGLE